MLRESKAGVPLAGGWRDALLVSLVALGAALTLMTELLSPFHAVRRPPLLVLWCLVALWWGRRFAHPGQRSAQRNAANIFDALAVAGIGVIALVAAFTALASPPNSVDAFGYHLARVVYWAQAGSVAFFPTHYFNQISMPPMAEYVMLHSYVLSGGDRLIDLVQWGGFVGSVVGVSSVAEALGAGRRGQVLASVFCATIPNGILQASGAKNDCVLALWLVALVYFALRFARQPGWAGAVWLGLSLGLALLTKATAFLFAPALLLGAAGAAAWSSPWPGRARLLRAVGVAALCIAALDGPQWWRNFSLSGSILGFPAAQDDGRFRWTNGRPGFGATVSNLLRNGSQQLAGRDPGWNRAVYQAVLSAHRVLGIDVDDPATTWPESRFAPPVNSNHEADAPNRWHFLLLVLTAVPLAVWARSRAGRHWLAYYLGLVLASVAFCAVLRYQPFFSRLFLPLFVLGAPVFGVLAEKIRPAVLQAVLCLVLFDQTRHALFQNWTRPLTGEASILRTPRNANYFRDMKQFGVDQRDYERAVDIVLASGCNDVGIDNGRFQLEYPFQALLLQRNPRARFFHAGVTNATARYAPAAPPRPCAVLCLGCAGVPGKMEQYRQLGEPVAVNQFLIYAPARL